MPDNGSIETPAYARKKYAEKAVMSVNTSQLTVDEQSLPAPLEDVDKVVQRALHVDRGGTAGHESIERLERPPKISEEIKAGQEIIEESATKAIGKVSESNKAEEIDEDFMN